MTRKQPERGLQYRCQQWLEKSGVWERLLIFHVPNERMGGIGAIIHFKRMGVRPGVADYLVFTPGRMTAIELKAEGKKQRTGQETFQKQWAASGGVYFIVRTLEEFQGVIDGITVFG